MPPPVHEWLRPFVVLIVAMLGIENLQKDQSVINNSTKTTVNNLSCPYRDTKSSIGGHWQWNTSHLYDFCSAMGNFFFMFSTVQGSNHHSYCNCQIYPKKKKKIQLERIGIWKKHVYVPIISGYSSLCKYVLKVELTIFP